MSKDLFHRYREEEIHTMVSMPYNDYKQLVVMWENPNLNLVKHYHQTEKQKP